MNTLRWSPFPGADVASYKVYRSMIGFSAPVLTPSALAGKTLILRLNNGPSQTITFDGVMTPYAKINATLQGGHAYLSVEDSNYFLVRSDVRSAPGNISILGGTSLTDFGLVTRAIYEKSEDALIAQVPALSDPDAQLEYQDEDGVCQDWYAISTVSGLGEESLKTPYRQPMTYTGELCVIEGIVTTLQGARVPDAEVKATIIKFPQEVGKAPQITREPITTLTGSDGRFSIPLLQGTLVQFEIPAVEFIRNITVPAKPCEFLTDLQVDLDYRYPLETNI